jgi:hypothetical protein
MSQEQQQVCPRSTRDEALLVGITGKCYFVHPEAFVDVLECRVVA